MYQKGSRFPHGKGQILGKWGGAVSRLGRMPLPKLLCDFLFYVTSEFWDTGIGQLA